MSREFDLYFRDVRFEPEEEPCLPLEEFFSFMHIIAMLLDAYRRGSPVSRYGMQVHRRCLSGDLTPFKLAVDIWLHAVKNSSRAGYTLWSALSEPEVREKIRRAGMLVGHVYYYIRFLGLYLTDEDIRLIMRARSEVGPIPLHVSRGFLYFAFKVVYTAEYREERTSGSYRAQVEVLLTAPALELRGNSICVDVSWLNAVAESLMDATAYLTSTFVRDEGEQFRTLMENIIENKTIEGYEWLRTCITWGFERQTYVRWCGVFLQKLNVYGSYPLYEYDSYIVRKPYPDIRDEATEYLEEGRVSLARRYFIDYKKTRSETRDHVIPPIVRASAIYESGALERTLEEIYEAVAKLEAESRASVLTS